MVKKGDKVTAGQPIAKVGHLVGVTVVSDMLDFEMYSKSAAGPLTFETGGKLRSDGVPFKRRSDLINPTQYLNKWKSKLPT